MLCKLLENTHRDYFAIFSAQLDFDIGVLTGGRHTHQDGQGLLCILHGGV